MRLRSGIAALGAISAITVCGGEIPVAEAESVGMSTERLKRIDTAMRRHIDAGKIQGAVTAVARGGKVVHFKAHGRAPLACRARRRTISTSSRCWRTAANSSVVVCLARAPSR